MTGIYSIRIVNKFHGYTFINTDAQTSSSAVTQTKLKRFEINFRQESYHTLSHTLTYLASVKIICSYVRLHVYV